MNSGATSPTLQSKPSVYFTEGYLEAAVAGSPADSLRVSTLDGQWQMPLVVTSLETGGFQASSPYGYSGIHVDRSVSRDTLLSEWRTAIEMLSLRGVVSIFLRFAPFDTGSMERVRGLPGLSLVHISDTISVPTPDPASVWSGMQGRARTAIRKAQKLGMTGSVEPASRGALEAGGDFRRLYENTMRRVNAAPHHFYPDSYYETLRESLGELLQVVCVRNAEGMIVAAALMLVDEDVVHYHLSGSDPVEARNGANNLLLWTLLQWSADNHRGSAHLGGGTSAEDSLYKFKASFGGTALKFTIGMAIVDEERYWSLVRERAAALECSVESLVATNYFPAFRATGSTHG